MKDQMTSRTLVSPIAHMGGHEFDGKRPEVVIIARATSKVAE